MDVVKIALEPSSSKGVDYQELTLCLHAFSNLSNVSPATFLYLLKECYCHGTLKGTKKFQALRRQVHHGLHNGPRPGAATFVVHCLYILPIFELYSEGFSHLIVSSFRRLLELIKDPEDFSRAKHLAAQLYYDVVVGFVNHDERIVVKILEVFDVRLSDIEKVIGRLKANDNCRFESAKIVVENYIFELMKAQSYMTVVSLLEHFSIRQAGESFLFKMMESKQSKAAEKWATFMGKPMLCTLVKEYVERNMLDNAYDAIKKNNLQQEFPEVYHKCKENLLKKLAEKGCWDVAERKTNHNKQLIEYLVYLAMQAGYSEKVDELCKRYSLHGFVEAKEPEVSLLYGRYLQPGELLVEDIIWIDEVNGLRDATTQIEECKVVSLDCEWKPNYEKGSKPNKVSIMQIATGRVVFILDLIRLFKDAPETLDDCLTRILQSTRILKLGYSFQCDIKQLSHSYSELKCFNHYEMLLDIQNLFKEPHGGLSGLAKKILGVGLNKTRRNSNWEQRPLSQHQLEYAALDAAVLHHIFRHIRTYPQNDNIKWTSQLVGKQRRSKHLP